MLRVGLLTSTQAMLIGLFAPICWGMSVSLVRGIAEGFGMALGQFFPYCVATICVFFHCRFAGLSSYRQAVSLFRHTDGKPELSEFLSGHLYFERRRADDGSRHGQLFVAVTHNSLCRAL